jgi:uncharacterized protein (TIGR03083 family)
VVGVTESSTDALIAALHASQDRLAAALDGLTGEQAGSQSYDDDWTVAQVASHLGSSAVIFTGHLASGRDGRPAAGPEAAQVVWAEWDAKEPGAQVRDCVAANAAFLAEADALTDEQRGAWRLDLFGMDLDLAGFLQLRVGEHVLHTWDITVSLDSSSTIPADHAAQVVANLPMVAGWTGQKHDEQLSVEVRTSAPERALHLDLGPGGVQLAPSSDDTAASAVLALPTEAFVRLVYGRLDPDHTPDSVEARGVDLDLLRSIFPGV